MGGPRSDVAPTARTGVSVDDWIAAEKQRDRRAIAAGFDPGPPLEIAIIGEVTENKGRWVRRLLAHNVFSRRLAEFRQPGRLCV
jgi:hypothetical protein